MSISQAIRVSRKFRGLKQSELDVPYTQQMLSMIESGHRDIAKDMAPILAAKLDHPAVYAEMARELTGFGPSWLDGPNVDLHRASVREVCLREMREAIEAIERFNAATPPHAETEGQRKDRYKHLQQAMDAMVAAFIYIGVECLEYGFSMRQVSEDHRHKLRSMRYVASV